MRPPNSLDGDLHVAGPAILLPIGVVHGAGREEDHEVVVFVEKQLGPLEPGQRKAHPVL